MQTPPDIMIVIAAIDQIVVMTDAMIARIAEATGVMIVPIAAVTGAMTDQVGAQIVVVHTVTDQTGAMATAQTALTVMEQVTGRGTDLIAATIMAPVAPIGFTDAPTRNGTEIPVFGGRAPTIASA